MIRLALLTTSLALGGCAVLATPPGAGLAGAALGATAAAFNLDTEILKIWDERNSSAEQKKP